MAMSSGYFRTGKSVAISVVAAPTDSPTGRGVPRPDESVIEDQVEVLEINALPLAIQANCSKLVR